MNSAFPCFVGLDIGTSATRCVIGTIGDGETQPSIIGYASTPNLGMRKGTVVHVDDVADSIVLAISEAEKIAGIKVDTATVNVSGSHVGGLNSKGVIAISTANHEIAVEDRMRAEEAATIIQLPPNKEIIQVFAKGYRLDGNESIKDPVGMHGVRLEVETHIVTVSTSSIRSLDTALEKANVRPVHHTTSGLAASEAVLSRQQKESGTLVLDIGAGVTSLAVMEDGEVQHVAVIPMGGINMTNDLAIGLRTDLDIAEAVKKEFGTLKDVKHRIIKVKHEGAEHEFDIADVQMILTARVEELFEHVDKELKKIQRSRKLPGGVVIVGGVSKLPGIADFAKSELELPARVGKIMPVGGISETVEDGFYTTAVGLMWLDMLLGQDNDSQFTGVRSFNDIKQNAKSIFSIFKKR